MRRAEHSTALVNGEKIYIFGGYDKDFTLYNSIQKLDLAVEKELTE